MNSSASATSLSANAGATGLHFSQLAGYGLQVIEGHGIQGSLVYERPAIVFDPRRIKNCSIGAFSYINGYQSGAMYASAIGRYCSIGEDVVIGAPEHPIDWLSTHPFAFTRPEQMPKFYMSPEFTRLGPDDSAKTRWKIPMLTTIGHDVWIGTGAYIKRGITIGNGAIIGARAVVTHDVPPYAIVAGTPARIMRYRFADVLIERLLQLQWWRYDLAPHKYAADFSKVVETLDVLEECLQQKQLELLIPETWRLTVGARGFDLASLPTPLY